MFQVHYGEETAGIFGSRNVWLKPLMVADWEAGRVGPGEECNTWYTFQRSAPSDLLLPGKASKSLKKNSTRSQKGVLKHEPRGVGRSRLYSNYDSFI